MVIMLFFCHIYQISSVFLAQFRCVAYDVIDNQVQWIPPIVDCIPTIYEMKGQDKTMW